MVIEGGKIGGYSKVWYNIYKQLFFVLLLSALPENGQLGNLFY